MAIETNKPDNYRELPAFLKRAIDEEIKKATEIEIEEAKKRIDKRKSEIVAGVVIYVQKMIQMQSLDNNLIITVKVQ